ncbi:MAG: phosphoenolpyruvate carboxykinase (GTP), partial [Nitrososphaeraceae archaeon]|nr:phosphoenolpyruvate carboxykinase (GTP) [Nitrososphaeraceae archaeon]
MGASIASAQTAAAEGTVGVLRRDPFAMLPFCGYNIGDYFKHWLSFDSNSLPKGFTVNWFRKGADGKYLWPGYCENMRVLEWIFNRCNNDYPGIETIIGYIPHNLNVEGLNVDMEELFRIDPIAVTEERADFEQYLDNLKINFD